MGFAEGPNPLDDAPTSPPTRPAPGGDSPVMRELARPSVCQPAAHRLLQKWAGMIDAPHALIAGACAIAMHGNDSVRPDTVDRQLNDFAQEVRRRVKGQQEQAMLAHLHDYLFEQLGFCGDTRDYYNPANSDLAEVVRRRRGLPILLSLIYKEVIGRLGLRADGVALPGHFIVNVHTASGPMLVDPFFGGVLLSRDEALERVRAMLGDQEPWDDAILEPVSHRHWLTRILQNLLGSYSAGGRYGDVAAMLELEMLLWPDQTHLQRDLGLCLARIGMPVEAAGCLKRYLATDPDDPQTPDLQDLLSALV